MRGYKILLICLCIQIFLTGYSWCQDDVLQKQVTVNQTQGPLSLFLQQLKTQNGINFSYSESTIQVEQPVSISQTTNSLQNMLQEMLNGTGIRYLVQNQVIILSKSAPGKASLYVINGYVRDSASRENLIGATIMEVNTGRGTITNNYGFFSLTLPAGDVRLVTSYVGHKSRQSSFHLHHDTTMYIAPSVPLMAEIEVTSSREKEDWESSQTGAFSMPMDELNALPALLGENDFTRTIQLLPGVHGGTEISSGLYVRGGGPDQNLVLMDGVPVYNAFHLLGFYSIFNDDAINSIRLLKSGFPARYGGRLSSVLDISIKEGNQQQWHGEGSLGLLTTKVLLEGPVNKNKTSVLVSARRSYLDFYTSLLLLASPDDTRLGYYFYDVNFKINHRFSDKDRIYFSTYVGKDKAFVEGGIDDEGTQVLTDLGILWGNRIASFRWNHLFSDNLFSNVTLSYSKYQFETTGNFLFGDQQNDFQNNQDIQYFSGIRDISIRTDWDYYIQPWYLLRFGGYATFHHFTAGALRTSGIFENEQNGNPPIESLESAVYLENDFEINSKLQMNAGLHFASFLVNQTRYFSLQPRLAVRWQLTKPLSVKASYARMAQNVHLLTNIGVGLPTDLWVPATDRVRPQLSDQWSLGLYQTLPAGFNLSLEGFYKRMQHLIEFKDGASYLDFEDEWQDLVTTGKGWSRGVELLLKRQSGKFTGWAGYTYSITDRQFAQLNQGKRFPYTFDRRHDIGLAINYKKSKKFDVGITWTYGTGNAISLPSQSYFTQGENPQEVFLYQERNQHRMRSYHRMDIGLNWHKQKKLFLRTWSLGFYNVYNRQNPFFIFPAINEDGQRIFNEFSLFPIIPSVSYKIKF